MAHKKGHKAITLGKKAAGKLLRHPREARDV